MEDNQPDDVVVELNPGQRISRGQPRAERDENGRIPAFVPTNEQRHTVMVLAANNDTQAVIAQALNIHHSTLVKYFKKEIKTGRAQIVARVGYTVVKEALAGNMAAARFWLQTHGGPSWQLPKEAPGADPETSRDDEVVHFYMPPNGRDQPEADDAPPTIDGDATEAPPAATGTDP